jgi:hypothetical protein
MEAPPITAVRVSNRSRGRGENGEHTDLERAVQEQQPDLRLVMEGDSPSFRGSYQHPTMALCSTVSRSGLRSRTESPGCLGSRKSAGAFHGTSIDTYFEKGAICTEVPELTLLRGRYSRMSYLDGPVRNYFHGQVFVEQGQKWPFGEWDHGKPALIFSVVLVSILPTPVNAQPLNPEPRTELFVSAGATGLSRSDDCGFGRHADAGAEAAFRLLSWIRSSG